jgi:TonB family protein
MKTVMLLAAILLSVSAARDKSRPAISLKPYSAWIEDTDYPGTAMREDQTGAVWFRIEVDAAGAVSRCSVIASSGSPVLDAATCRLLSQRARFRPALDAAGSPVPAHMVSAVSWRTAVTTPMQRTSWARTAQIETTAGGELATCAMTDSGAKAKGYYDLCDAPHLSTGGPHRFMRRIEQVVDGAGSEAFTPPPGATMIDTATMHYSIKASGTIHDCTVERTARGETIRAKECGSDRYTAIANGAPDSNVVWTLTTWDLGKVAR